MAAPRVIATFDQLKELRYRVVEPAMERALSNFDDNASHGRVDRFGAVASSLCAIHCTVAALLPALFGTLGLGLLLGHEAEWVFTAVALGFAVLALLFTWRRHRSTLVAGLMAVGIVGLMASRGLEMGGEHGEHHGQAEHHAQEEHHGHGHEEHQAQAHAPGEHHEGGSHLAGTVVGVLAGISLVSGHVIGLRKSRECREACAEEGSS